MPATHTPTHGPWICYADLPSADPDWHIITTANKLRVIANVHIEPGNTTDAANAALIAAAPDLLAALSTIVSAMTKEGGMVRLDGDELAAARAAIAKATAQ